MLVLLPDLMALVFDYAGSTDIVRCLDASVFTKKERDCILSKTKECIQLPSSVKNRELQQYKTAKFLSLFKCNSITDAGVKQLKRLRTLDLTCCKKITNAGLKHLKGIYKLNLCACPLITDPGLKNFNAEGLPMLVSKN